MSRALQALQLIPWKLMRMSRLYGSLLKQLWSGFNDRFDWLIWDGEAHCPAWLLVRGWTAHPGAVSRPVPIVNYEDGITT